MVCGTRATVDQRPGRNADPHPEQRGPDAPATESPNNSDYGFGWYTTESAEGPPVRTSHSGAGAGFSAYEGLFPDSRRGVAVLINHGAGLVAFDPGVVGQNLLAALDPGIPTLHNAGTTA